MSSLLNKTIGNGVRLQAVVQTAVGVVTIGGGIDKLQRRARPIPCTIDARVGQMEATA